MYNAFLKFAGVDKRGGMCPACGKCFARLERHQSSCKGVISFKPLKQCYVCLQLYGEVNSSTSLSRHLNNVSLLSNVRFLPKKDVSVDSFEYLHDLSINNKKLQPLLCRFYRLQTGPRQAGLSVVCRELSSPRFVGTRVVG